MPRHTFGGDLSGWAFTAGPSGVVTLAPTATITFWTAASGGTQITDLASASDGTGAMTQVITGAGGDIPVFYGPDGVATMWASAAGQARRLMAAVDLVALDRLPDADGVPVGSVLTAAGAGAVARWTPPATTPLTSEAYQRGVSFAGLDFTPATVPGTLSTDYFLPPAADFAYARACGLTIARVPFTWDRAQPAINGALDDTYLGYVDQCVQAAADNGQRVVLDLHCFGRRYVGFPGGFSDTFASSVGTWSGGSLSGGRYITDQATYFTKISGGDARNPVSPAGGYVFTVDCYITAEQTGGGNFPALWVRAFDNLQPTVTASYYQVSLDRYGQLVKWSKVVNGTATAIGQSAATISLNTVYTVVIDVNQSSVGNVVVKVNGTTYATFATDPALTGGRVAVATSFTKAAIDNASLNVAGDTTGAASSGTYRVGDPQLPVAAFADVWSRMALRWRDKPAVWAYELANEPHDMPVETLPGTFASTATVTVMHQAAIDAIRLVDTTRWIILNLDQWSGFQNFTTLYGSNPAPWWTDPAGRCMVGAHYYFDSDHSGTYGTAWSSTLRTRIPGEVTPLLAWGVAHGVPIFAGEYGVPYAATSDGTSWRTDLGTFLDLLNTYGAHGAYWSMGNAYTASTSVQPRTGGVTDYTVDATQMAVLTGRLGTRTLPVPAQFGGTGITRPGTVGNVLTSTGSGWASTTPAGSSAVSAAGIWLPTDHGWLAWAFDPATAVNSSAATGGVLYLVKVKLSTAATVATVAVYSVTAGSGLTSGQCLAGLYSATGTLLASTADQSGTWNSSGAKTMTLTVPYVAVAASYYVGLLANGTTGPAFARATSSGAQAANTGLSSSAYRFGQYGAGQTALPSSVTVASMTNGTGYFAAVA